MKTKFLFPNKFKSIAWFVLFPTAIFGVVTLFVPFEPAFLDFNLPTIFKNSIGEETNYFGLVKNNVMNEIIGILLILSLIFVAFSKEKIEDELVSKIRLEALVWSVYINYTILLLAFIFVFDLAFLWVMICNMFTVLIFFIARFQWKISKLKKESNHAE
jgi:hypothetical protein